MDYVGMSMRAHPYRTGAVADSGLKEAVPHRTGARRRKCVLQEAAEDTVGGGPGSPIEKCSVTSKSGLLTRCLLGTVRSVWLGFGYSACTPVAE